MIDRIITIENMEKSGVVAVVRVDDNSKVSSIVKALCDGGVNAIEITMTIPGAIEIIEKIASQHKNDVIVGAGTVLDPETARMVISAGARFVVSPVLNIEVIQLAHRYDVAAIPGAYTPSEILSAWENGADIVKVFPATALGPQYFKDIHGPLPQIKLTPTGGVSLENTTAFMKAGACCVGVGSALVSKEFVSNNDWTGLKNRARNYIDAVNEGRKIEK